MPVFAGLHVLFHRLAKTNGLQLGSHGCTLRSGAGEAVSGCSTYSGLSEAVVPQGLLPGGPLGPHLASHLLQKLGVLQAQVAAVLVWDF